MINIKNKDNECFRWCHVRHLNPQELKIKKADKKYVEKLDYTGIEFPVNVKQYNNTEKQNTIESMYLAMRKDSHSPFTYPMKGSKTK